MADYPRLRFTFRCDLARVINLICIVLYCIDSPLVVAMLCSCLKTGSKATPVLSNVFDPAGSKSADFEAMSRNCKFKGSD